MADYVRRGKVEFELCGGNLPEKYKAFVRRVLNDKNLVPAADVAEVVYGRWIDGAEDFTCGNYNAECSICRCYVSWDGCDEDFNYCPNCGAKMDGGEDRAVS